MPRDHHVGAERARVLRAELARTRARLDAALTERADLERRLGLLLDPPRDARAAGCRTTCCGA